MWREEPLTSGLGLGFPSTPGEPESFRAEHAASASPIALGGMAPLQAAGRREGSSLRIAFSAERHAKSPSSHCLLSSERA